MVMRGSVMVFALASVQTTPTHSPIVAFDFSKYVTCWPLSFVNEKLLAPEGQQFPDPLQLYWLPVRMERLMLSITNERLETTSLVARALRFRAISETYALIATVTTTMKSPIDTISSTNVNPRGFIQ